MICAIISLHQSHISSINSIINPFSQESNGRIKSMYRSAHHPYIIFVSFDGLPGDLGDYINIDLQTPRCKYIIIGLDKFYGYVDVKLHEWITNNG